MLESESFGWKQMKRIVTLSQVRSYSYCVPVRIIQLTVCEESSLELAFGKGVGQGGDPRIMLINTPSNPTGQSFNQHDVDTITAFCQRHNITLISDEIYSDISFSEEYSATPCSGSQFNVGQKILTGGLSKVHISFTGNKLVSMSFK